MGTTGRAGDVPQLPGVVRGREADRLFTGTAGAPSGLAVPLRVAWPTFISVLLGGWGTEARTKGAETVTGKRPSKSGTDRRSARRGRPGYRTAGEYAMGRAGRVLLAPVPWPV
ncbi:hypothetical protein BB341_22665 [Streptomyces clavuligerus]|nr:hypothetical protein BB341_22665 [Streptomyces clavuligerus]AXU15438.1 hypothetical protein D1794_23565 [Streptomyces clavuligerus]QCS08214.1 hypothetical protein CRV15_22930 [Streptomyces clavuligerus]